MEEENLDTLNLDLDLGSGVEPTTTIANEAFLGTNEVLRPRAQHRWRWRHILIHEHEGVYDPDPPEPHNNLRELNHSLLNFGNGNVVESSSVGVFGLSSWAPHVSPTNASQVAEGSVVSESIQKKDDIEQGIASNGKFFECSICLDLAKDPVVTSCGHLFCWRCLFGWLHMHSSSKECPNCKGEVIIEKITPIYECGNDVRMSEREGSDPKIPRRPRARRVDNLRETLERNAFSPLFEEILQRVGIRNGLSRDFSRPCESTNTYHEEAVIGISLMRRLLTSRGMRDEQNFVAPQEHSPPLDDKAS